MNKDFNLNFKPKSYFQDLTLETKLRSKIKGQMRGKMVSENIEKGSVPQELLKSGLNDTLKYEQGRIHPWMMGGEYLEDLKESEVEICRTVLKSTTMDVCSMRARITDKGLSYRVVDEYGDYDFILPITESSNPLTMKQVIENLDFCKEVFKGSGAVNDYGGGGMVRPWLFQQFEFGDSREDISDFITIESAFYPELEEYYEYKKLVWIDEMIKSKN